MTSASSPLLAALRRHWLLILVTGLVFGLAGAGWALTRPVRYTSTATVLLDPLIGAPYTGQTGKAADGSMQEERALLLSSANLAEAATKAGADVTVSDLRQGVDAQVVSNTTIIEVTYTADDRESAQTGAQAVADVYLTRRKAEGVAEVTAQLAALKKEQDANTKRIEDQTAALAEAQSQKDSPKAKALNAELASLTDQGTELLRQGSQLRQTLLNAGSVIEPAAPGASLSRLFDLAVVAIATVVGLLLGLGIGLWRRIRDSRVHGPQDVLNELVLAHVRTGDPDLVEPVTATGVGSETEESYRRLRIAVSAAVTRPAVVTVTSVGSPLAAAAAGANLAVSATHTGASVVLVDASPECGLSGATALLRGQPGPGLVEALTDSSRSAPCCSAASGAPSCSPRATARSRWPRRCRATRRPCSATSGWASTT